MIEEPAEDYQSFRRKVYDNKTFVKNCLSQLIEDMNSGMVNCKFVLCIVLKKNLKWESSVDQKGRNLQK